MESRLVPASNSENSNAANNKATDGGKTATAVPILDSNQQALRNLAVTGLYGVAKGEEKTKFQALSLGDLIQWGVDNAKTYDICKEFKAAYDANGCDVHRVPPSAVALLLKLKLLLIRQESVDLQAKSAQQDLQAVKKGLQGGSPASRSAAVVKQKDAAISGSNQALASTGPAQSSSASNVASAGSTRRRSKLRDRGSNPNLDIYNSTAIQRFPENGQDMYIMLVDFVELAYYIEFEKLILPLNAIFCIDGCVVSRSQREELSLLKQAKQLDPKYDVFVEKSVSLSDLAASFDFLNDVYASLGSDDQRLKLTDTSIVRISAHDSKDFRELLDVVIRSILKVNGLSDQLESIFSVGRAIDVPAYLQSPHQAYCYAQQQLAALLPTRIQDLCAANLACLVAVEQASRAHELEPAVDTTTALERSSSAGGAGGAGGDDAKRPESASAAIAQVSGSVSAVDALAENTAKLLAIKGDSALVFEQYLESLLNQYVSPPTCDTVKSVSADKSTSSISYESCADEGGVLTSQLETCQRQLGFLDLASRSKMTFVHSQVSQVIDAYYSLARDEEFQLTMEKVDRDRQLLAAQVERQCFSGTANVQGGATNAVLSCELARILAPHSSLTNDEMLRFVNDYCWLEKLDKPQQVASIASQLKYGAESAHSHFLHHYSLATNQLILAVSRRPLFVDRSKESEGYFAKAKFGMRLFSEIEQDFPHVLEKLLKSESQPWYYTGLDEVVNLSRSIAVTDPQCVSVKFQRGWGRLPVTYSHYESQDDSFRISAFFANSLPLAVTCFSDSPITVGIAFAEEGIKLHLGALNNYSVTINTFDNSITFDILSSGPHVRATEIKRTILSDGTIISHYRDGTSNVFFPTGSRVALPSAGEAAGQKKPFPIFTSRTGERRYIGSNGDLDDGPVTVQENIQENRKVYIKSDLSVVSVHKETGDCSVLWADGTNVDYNSCTGAVVIRHPEFGTVSVADSKLTLSEPNFRLHAESSTHKLSLRVGDCDWSVDRDASKGTLLFTPYTAGGDKRSVRVNMETCEISSEDQSDRVLTSPMDELSLHPPDFFLVQPDGSTVYRLMHASLVQSLVAKTREQALSLKGEKFAPLVVDERYNSLKTLLLLYPQSAAKAYYRCLLQRPPLEEVTLKDAQNLLDEIALARQNAFADTVNSQSNTKASSFHLNFWEELKQSVLAKSLNSWESSSGNFNDSQKSQHKAYSIFRSA